MSAIAESSSRSTDDSAALRERIASASVVVLMGGRSSERDVSLATGAAIVSALATPSGRGDHRGPREVIAVEIESSGSWRVGDARRAPSEAIGSLDARALYFVGLHGGDGENGTLQGLLESHGRAYTGSGVGASALCMNKHLTRLALASAGLTVAPAVLVTPYAWRAQREHLLARIADFAHAGASVKPNAGGSSVSTFLVDHARDVAGAIEQVHASGDAALVEAWIRGTEATCGVLGNCDGEMRALPPVEIVPHGTRFFDYQQKYATDGAVEFCPPRTLSDATCARLCALSEAAHRAAGCDGYSRTDYIVPRSASGQELEPVVLEINTLPGMTPRSLLPKAASASGLTLRDLCLQISMLALARHDRDARSSGSTTS